MSDTPAPTPAPEPSSRYAASAFISKTILGELSLASALSATYASQLALEAITPAFLTATTAKLGVADGLIATITGKSADKHSATRHEKAAKDALLAQITKIQSRAKGVYKRADGPQRKRYFIGVRLSNNRAEPERAGKALLLILGEKALPTQTAADTTAFGDALTAYSGAQTSQTGDQTAATKAHADLKKLTAGIADDRRTIQYAVDAQWPHDDPVSRVNLINSVRFLLKSLGVWAEKPACEALGLRTAFFHASGNRKGRRWALDCGGSRASGRHGLRRDQE
jgi:hypothetical protein